MASETHSTAQSTSEAASGAEARPKRFELSQGLAAVLVAAIGLVGAAIGHFLTSITSREVAQTNATATALLEQQKFVQSTISAIIGKGTEQEQIKLLRFYAKIGVVGEPYATKINKLPDSELPFSTVPTTLSARQQFFAAYRAKFGTLSDESEADLTRIFSFIQNDKKMTDVRQVAYVLATIQHETNKTFKPMPEVGSDELIEARYGQRLGNDSPGDGARYRGRGYVQLTGKANYRRLGQALGLGDDLVANPEKVLEPEIAYSVMAAAMKTGFFSGKKLDDYISGAKADYVGARQIVNARQEAQQIAESARSLEAILRGVLTEAK